MPRPFHVSHWMLIPDVIHQRQRLAGPGVDTKGEYYATSTSTHADEDEAISLSTISINKGGNRFHVARSDRTFLSIACDLERVLLRKREGFSDANHESFAMSGLQWHELQAQSIGPCEKGPTFESTAALLAELLDLRDAPNRIPRQRFSNTQPTTPRLPPPLSKEPSSRVPGTLSARPPAEPTPAAPISTTLATPLSEAPPSPKAYPLEAPVPTIEVATSAESTKDGGIEEILLKILEKVQKVEEKVSKIEERIEGMQESYDRRLKEAHDAHAVQLSHLRHVMGGIKGRAEQRS